MALYDSAHLLKMFNRLTGRAATAADPVVDADKYERLSEAQVRVIAEASSRTPESFYQKGALGVMSTSGNKVFTFGTTANGFPVTPIGKTRIYRNLGSHPDYPMLEGYDYLNEGSQIRIPNDRTEAGPLYWYGIAQPTDLGASAQPSLFPEGARELIVYEAALHFALEGERNVALAQSMQELLATAYLRWFLVWRTQYNNGGALVAPSGLKLAMLASP
jgi:hypothetical protein